jgi:hypothetical protein
MVVIDPATAATFGFDINSSGGAYQSGKAYGILKKIELVDKYDELRILGRVYLPPFECLPKPSKRRGLGQRR